MVIRRLRVDPRLGLRNRFSELDDRSSIIQDISKLPHFQRMYRIHDFVGEFSRQHKHRSEFLTCRDKRRIGKIMKSYLFETMSQSIKHYLATGTRRFLVGTSSRGKSLAVLHLASFSCRASVEYNDQCCNQRMAS